MNNHDSEVVLVGEAILPCIGAMRGGIGKTTSPENPPQEGTRQQILAPVGATEGRIASPANSGFVVKPVFCISMVLFMFMSACYHDTDTWTDKDHVETLHYFDSLRDNKEASRIARQAGSTFSPQQLKQVRALTASALDEARQVSDELLDKVHPELKKHYREEYQRALELALQNLEYQDYSAAQKSTVLFSNYSDWFVAHQSDIHFPH
jgi:hypothetical protein